MQVSILHVKCLSPFNACIHCIKCDCLENALAWSKGAARISTELGSEASCWRCPWCWGIPSCRQNELQISSLQTALSDAETQLKLLLSFTSTVSIFWCLFKRGFKQHIVDDADGTASGVGFKLQHAVADFDPQSLAKSPLLPYQTLCKWTHVWRRRNQPGNFIEGSGKRLKISSTWFCYWGLDCYRTSTASCFEFWTQIQSIFLMCVCCVSLWKGGRLLLDCVLKWEVEWIAFNSSLKMYSLDN